MTTPSEVAFGGLGFAAFAAGGLAFGYFVQGYRWDGAGRRHVLDKHARAVSRSAIIVWLTAIIVGLVVALVAGIAAAV